MIELHATALPGAAALALRALFHGSCVYPVSRMISILVSQKKRTRATAPEVRGRGESMFGALVVTYFDTAPVE
jgi:hypothetical protein